MNRPFSVVAAETQARTMRLLAANAARMEPLLTDETPIFWENVDDEDGTITHEDVLYGDLMVQDRKTVQWDAASHRFIGGYPL